MCSLLTLFSSASIEFLSNCSHRPSPSTIEPRIWLGWDERKECWELVRFGWVARALACCDETWTRRMILTKKTKLNAHRMYFAHAEPQSWLILWLCCCLSWWFILRRWGNAKRRWLIDKQFSNSSLSSGWVWSSNFDDSTAVDLRYGWWRFCKRKKRSRLVSARGGESEFGVTLFHKLQQLVYRVAAMDRFLFNILR